MNNIIDVLNWRYATKRMNGEKVPDEKIETILDAIRLAPSSMGLQPYSVLVISDEETKKKLSPAAMNQPQIIESSHLVIFAAWSDIKLSHIKEFIEDTAKTRGISVENLAGFEDMMASHVESLSVDERVKWAREQAHIALGVGLVAAASLKVDATPMGGFSPQMVDEVLGLKEKGLTSAIFMALGYRDEENDKYVKLKKVRREKEKLFIRI